MRSLLIPALLLAAAPAAAQRRDPVAATPAGKPVNCVQITQIRRTEVRDDRTIDFFMRAKGLVYRNTLPNSCPELGFEQRFAYSTSIDRLCSVDIITVIRTGPRGASCGLGEFQPVTLAKPSPK